MRAELLVDPQLKFRLKQRHKECRLIVRNLHFGVTGAKLKREFSKVRWMAGWLAVRPFVFLVHCAWVARSVSTRTLTYTRIRIVPCVRF